MYNIFCQYKKQNPHLTLVAKKSKMGDKEGGI